MRGLTKLRKDDVIGCKNIRCRKRFEIAGLRSLSFLDSVVVANEHLPRF